MGIGTFREVRDGRWSPQAAALFEAAGEPQLRWERSGGELRGHLGGRAVVAIRREASDGYSCRIAGFEWRSQYPAGRTRATTYTVVRLFPDEAQAMATAEYVLRSAPRLTEAA